MCYGSRDKMGWDGWMYRGQASSTGTPRPISVDGEYCYGNCFSPVHKDRNEQYAGICRISHLATTHQLTLLWYTTEQLYTKGPTPSGLPTWVTYRLCPGLTARKSKKSTPCYFPMFPPAKLRNGSTDLHCSAVKLRHLDYVYL